MNSNYEIWGYDNSKPNYKFLSCGQFPNKKPQYYFFIFRSDLDENNIHNIKVTTKEAEDIAAALPIAKDRVEKHIRSRRTNYYRTIGYHTTDIEYDTGNWPQPSDFIYKDTSDGTAVDWGNLDDLSSGSIAAPNYTISYDTASITDYTTNDQTSFYYTPPTGINLQSKDGSTKLELQHGSVYINGKKENDA